MCNSGGPWLHNLSAKLRMVEVFVRKSKQRMMWKARLVTAVKSLETTSYHVSYTEAEPFLVLHDMFCHQLGQSSGSHWVSVSHLPGLSSPTDCLVEECVHAVPETALHWAPLTSTGTYGEGWDDLLSPLHYGGYINWFLKGPLFLIFLWHFPFCFLLIHLAPIFRCCSAILLYQGTYRHQMLDRCDCASRAAQLFLGKSCWEFSWLTLPLWFRVFISDKECDIRKQNLSNIGQATAPCFWVSPQPL